MSHNDYARRQALWTGLAVPTARDLGIWDTYQYKAIDGVNGGVYAPRGPIVIGGAGLVLSGAGNFSNGGLSTAAGGRLQHGDADYVELVPSRTRTEVMSLIGMVPSTGSLPVNSGGGTPVEIVAVQDAPFGVGPFDKSVSFLSFAIPSRYLHNGANLISATLVSRAVGLYGGVPTGYTQANIVSVGPPYTTIPTVAGFLPGGLTAIAAWAPSTAYALGSVVIPSNASPAQTGLYYQVTAASGPGTSGSSPPPWPTTLGGTVTEGSTLTWTAVGYAGVRAVPHSPVAALSLVGTPTPMVMTPESTFTVDTDANEYGLVVFLDSKAAPVLTFHSLSLTYNNIVDMRFE